MQALYDVGGITNAMRAQKLLLSRGVHAYIRRHTDENSGCGYRLLVPQDSPQIAVWLNEARVSAVRINKGRESP